MTARQFAVERNGVGGSKLPSAGDTALQRTFEEALVAARESARSARGEEIDE